MGLRAAPPPGRLETFGDGQAKEPWGKPRDIWAPRPRDTWGFWAYIWVPCLCVLVIAVLVALDRFILVNYRSKVCTARWPGQVFLVFIGLSPLLCMLVLIEVFHDTLLAMLFMHWGCMLLLPVIHLICFAKDGSLNVYKTMLLDEFKTGPGMRFLLGGIVGTGILIIGLTGAALMSCRLLKWPLCIGSLDEHSRFYGLGYSLPFLISTSVYFCLVNPTFEELFWRVFLHREMGKDLFPYPDAKLPDSGDAEQEPPAAQLCSETGRWMVSFFYAAYHVVPVRFLVAASRAWWVGVLFVLGTLAVMSVLGRALVWARESPSLGVLGAWAIHVMVDVAVCLLFGASVFGYF